MNNSNIILNKTKISPICSLLRRVVVSSSCVCFVVVVLPLFNFFAEMVKLVIRDCQNSHQGLSKQSLWIVKLVIRDCQISHQGLPNQLLGIIKTIIRHCQSSHQGLSKQSLGIAKIVVFVAHVIFLVVLETEEFSVLFLYET